jgi:hypothetical protein
MNLVGWKLHNLYIGKKNQVQWLVAYYRPHRQDEVEGINRG